MRGGRRLHLQGVVGVLVGHPFDELVRLDVEGHGEDHAGCLLVPQVNVFDDGDDVGAERELNAWVDPLCLVGDDPGMLGSAGVAGRFMCIGVPVVCTGQFLGVLCR